ncbi:hypothetical protein D3C76_970490 [compost metagenome]
MIVFDPDPERLPKGNRHLLRLAHQRRDLEVSGHPGGEQQQTCTEGAVEIQMQRGRLRDLDRTRHDDQRYVLQGHAQRLGHVDRVGEDGDGQWLVVGCRQSLCNIRLQVDTQVPEDPFIRGCIHLPRVADVLSASRENAFPCGCVARVIKRRLPYVHCCDSCHENAGEHGQSS